MFISEAYAQQGGGGGGDLLISLLPLILIFVIFYFLLIRPQQKRAREHREMLGSIRRGDRIVTNGGLIGQVVKVGNDDELTVEIAEGVRVKVLRGMVANVLAKPEPAKKSRRKKDEGPVDDDAGSTPSNDDSGEDEQPAPKKEAAKGMGRFLGGGRS